jgi:uncharacterized protein YjhX (UPF0386 family)
MQIFGEIEVLEGSEKRQENVRCLTSEGLVYEITAKNFQDYFYVDSSVKAFIDANLSE